MLILKKIFGALELNVDVQYSCGWGTLQFKCEIKRLLNRNLLIWRNNNSKNLSLLCKNWTLSFKIFT